MPEETPYEATTRLQQQIEKIDDKIIIVRQKIRRNRHQVVSSEFFQRELENLLQKRDAISRNILQINKFQKQQS